MKPSLITRLRWRLEELRDVQDAKVIVGLLVLLVVAAGGFLAARTVAASASSAGPATRATLRVVTRRERVRVRVHGHVVTRWRVRKLYARPTTVMQTQTLHTPNGIRVVTHPVTHYQVVYRKHVVKVNGKTRTVLQPVTNTQTLTNMQTLTNTSTRTQLVTVTNQVTNQQLVTVTQPVTVVDTRTVVSTETETVPVTVTVTVPVTTTLP